jgi:hypothetical protein
MNQPAQKRCGDDMKIHSIDIEPGRDGTSHYLLANGQTIARFDDLQSAPGSRGNDAERIRGN